MTDPNAGHPTRSPYNGAGMHATQAPVGLSDFHCRPVREIGRLLSEIPNSWQRKMTRNGTVYGSSNDRGAAADHRQQLAQY